MELPRRIEDVNKFLKEQFGVDTITGLPIFRVSWSEDQYEKRHGTYDDFIPGTEIFLRTVTEVREVPKYKQWIHERYILERLVIVPSINQAELPTNNLSYEPLYVFQNDAGDYVPPTEQACKFIIDTVLSAQSVHKMMIDGSETADRPVARYTDSEDSHEGALAVKRANVDKLVEELFGDETGLMGQTLSRNQGGGQAIIVPNTYEGNKK